LICAGVNRPTCFGKRADNKPLSNSLTALVESAGILAELKDNIFPDPIAARSAASKPPT